MILLADLGNRSLSFSVYEQEKEIASFKTISDKFKSESEYEDTLHQFFRYQNIDPGQIEGALLASVVPSLTKRVEKAISQVIDKPCLLLNKTLKTSLALRMDNPNEVGSDLIANAIGAIKDYQCDCLIIDLSSVVSFSIATSDRQFLGGALFPGMRESVSHMCSTSAQLMEIELTRPNKLIGKSTKECMNSGIVLGYIFLLDSLSEQMEKEFRKPLKRILTGPDASIIKDYIGHKYTFNSHLVFDGLYEIYQKNASLSKERKENTL